MNQQFKVIVKLGKDGSRPPTAPSVDECRDIIERAVYGLADALAVRKLGTVSIEWLLGLSAPPESDEMPSRFRDTGEMTAVLTINHDYFAFYSPPTEWWVQHSVDWIDEQCQLAERPMLARVGDLAPLRVADTFEALLPIRLADGHIERDGDSITVAQSGTHETFDYYFEALDFAGEHLLTLNADDECELFALGDGYLLVESGRRFYQLAALPLSEVLRFAAEHSGSAVERRLSGD